MCGHLPESLGGPCLQAELLSPDGATCQAGLVRRCQHIPAIINTAMPHMLLLSGCPQTGFIDYDRLEEKALDFRPKMIICGGSAYPREWDYKRLRQVADKAGSYLMMDMAHIR